VIAAVRRLALEARARQAILLCNRPEPTMRIVRRGHVKVLKPPAPTARRRGLRRRTTTANGRRLTITTATIRSSALTVRLLHARIQHRALIPRRAVVTPHRHALILPRRLRTPTPLPAIPAGVAEAIIAAVAEVRTAAAEAEAPTAAALTDIVNLLAQPKSPSGSSGRAFAFTSSLRPHPSLRQLC